LGICGCLIVMVLLFLASAAGVGLFINIVKFFISE